ncbi:MAG UNVERIFIED_CONTAM: hypothetical protein LVQ98_02510 [Rickettsiaceae bacterium]|jgi:hypothetical protein
MKKECKFWKYFFEGFFFSKRNKSRQNNMDKRMPHYIGIVLQYINNEAKKLMSNKS